MFVLSFSFLLVSTFAFCDSNHLWVLAFFATCYICNDGSRVKASNMKKKKLISIEAVLEQVASHTSTFLMKSFSLKTLWILIFFLICFYLAL